MGQNLYVHTIKTLKPVLRRFLSFVVIEQKANVRSVHSYSLGEAEGKFDTKKEIGETVAASFREIYGSSVEY